MKIILGKTAGFCGGVHHAVEGTLEILKKNHKQDVYCLGELVHNKEVIKKLTQKGLRIIEDMKQARGKTIIRAHGTTKQIYDLARKKKVPLVDLTCKKVLKIHEKAKEYVKKGYYIFLIGSKNHPEVLGTYSFCGEHASQIEKMEDVETAIKDLQNAKIDKVAVLAQTTFSMEKFDAIVANIKQNISPQVFIKVNKTICTATKLRQEETEKIAKEVDCMIIIGGKNSSNTTKLYEIASKHCSKVYFVQTEQDLNLTELAYMHKVGIMAGASTPKESIHAVISCLKSCQRETVFAYSE